MSVLRPAQVKAITPLVLYLLQKRPAHLPAMDRLIEGLQAHRG
jgi:hypothetical protein